MAKHAVSFKQLLDIRWETRALIKSLVSIQEALPADMQLPVKCSKILREARERLAELDSIKHDRYVESMRIQEQIGCGVEF